MKKKEMIIIKVEIKRTKKIRYQEYEDYCDGNSERASDNDKDKTNKRTPSKKRNKQLS